MAQTAEVNKGGRPRNKPSVPAEDIPIVSLMSKGRHPLSKATGISKDDASTIQKVTGMTVEEFQEKQRDKLQKVMDLALAQTELMLPKASALQSATVYGILDDKHGRPKAGNQTLHIHLAPGDRSGAISALLGKHGERVSGNGDSVSTRPGSVSTRSDSVSTGPVIDLETPEPGHLLHTGDSQSPTKLPK
jgi:hypothetical protein